MAPGKEINLKIDPTLNQDATGTMEMLEVEALKIDEVQTHFSAQYVDHNIIQADFRHPYDHLFLLTACQQLGIWPRH